MNKQIYNRDFFNKVFSERVPEKYGTYKYFSVLVPLVFIDNEANLLFEVRADTLRRQPGEVCFPGGKMESGETPIGCAIRETSEELNISGEDIETIAELDYIYTYSNFTLYSFLGVINHDFVKRIDVNKDEVKEIFLVPWKFFMENTPMVYSLDVKPVVPANFPYKDLNLTDNYNWRKGTSTVPVYQYKGYTIWGLTAKIVYNMVNIIKAK